jgi:stage II sporulation protein M
MRTYAEFVKSYLKAIQIYVIGASFLFVVSIGAGIALFSYDTSLATQILGPLREMFGPLAERSSFELFSFILFHNLSKAFLVLLFSPFILITPVIFIAVNGFFFGMVAGVAVAQVGISQFFLAIFPHGVVEIPTIFLVAGASAHLGIKVMKNFLGVQKDLRLVIKDTLLFFILVLVPLFVIASFLESFLTFHLL